MAFPAEQKEKTFSARKPPGFSLHLAMQAAGLATAGFRQSTCRGGSSRQEQGKPWAASLVALASEGSDRRALFGGAALREPGHGTATFGGGREALARPRAAAAGVGSTAAAGEGRGRRRGRKAATYPGNTPTPPTPGSPAALERWAGLKAKEAFRLLL